MAKSKGTPTKPDAAKRPDRRGCPKGAGTQVGVNKQKTGRIGQPPFVATDLQRQMVIARVACGWRREEIAEKMGISHDTLTRHFRTELDEGDRLANAEVGGALYKEALKGDVQAINTWFDRRGGIEWRKKTGVELSGPGGKPVETRDVSKLTDAQLAALAALDDDAK